MLVRDVMSPRLVTISSDTSIRDCAHKMDRLSVGALVVMNNEKIVGFVTDRDICCRAVGVGRNLNVTTVKEIMTGFVNFCFEDQGCAEAAELMKAEHLRRLPVMDWDHHMVGMLSVDDIAHYSHQLAGKVLDSSSPICE